MKKYFLFVSICLCFKFSLVAQSGSKIKIQTSNHSTHLFFLDSLHKEMKYLLDTLNESHYCLITFKIDTSKQIDEFKIIEIPDLPLPTLAKTYLTGIFDLAWQHSREKIVATASCPQNYFLINLSLLKENESMNQRFKKTDKLVEYYFSGISSDGRLKNISLLCEQIMTLVY